MLSGLVGLKRVASAKRSTHAENREEHTQDFSNGRQPTLGEAFLEVIHRPAVDHAIGIHIAVLHTQRAFNKLGRHTQQTADNHPKRCPGTTSGNRDGDPSNVAQTNRSRNRGRESLEV